MIIPPSSTAPIFIFASGQRCGSTLLQRLLCSHPQIMIWGEHDGVLNKLFPQFERLLRWEEMFRHQYGLFLNDGINNFVPNMNPPRTVIYHAQEQWMRHMWQYPAEALGRPIWGFKEVLYDANMAQQLRTLFAGARILHLTRNIFECFISLKHEEYIPPEGQPHVPLEQVWTRTRTIEFINDWMRVNQSFIDHPLDLSWGYHITYEALVSNPQQSVQRLADWLGLNAEDFDLDVFRYKLYTDRHKGDDQRPSIRRADLTAEEVALVTTPELLRISAYLNYDMSIE
jgi:hypothetical protein